MEKQNSEDVKRKRRAVAQGQKACNPCRLRKVKCSYQSPCQTCVEREHPELCLYDAPQKRVRLEPSPAAAGPYQSPSSNPYQSPSSTSAQVVQREEWKPTRREWNEMMDKLDSLGKNIQDLQSKLARNASQSHEGDSRASEEVDNDAGKSRDMHTAHPLTGETIFLGGNSVPAMALALSRSNESDAVRDLLDKSILPIFTLDNESATYPFVDLWGLPHASSERVEKLCALLPSDSECLQYLRQYRDTAHVLFPGIINMQQFEAEVTRFLVTRTAQLGIAERLLPTEVYGRSIHWLGLLFACLASGCQCSSNIPRRERQLTSQVYVCCAYECLRIINYLSCAQLIDIQNLLVLGNVISNNMNAGVAWTLLGLTIRLAQGLGLHHAPPSHLSAEEAAVRQEVWSRIIWQDSLLSISYDRATSTMAMTTWDVSPPSGPESYAECMLQLCTIALDMVNSRASSASAHRELQRIEGQRQKISSIDRHSSSHLRELSACATMKDCLEHWNWRMHRSYVISELCRPVLTKGEHLDGSTLSLRAVCIEALADTVDAFLNLYNLTAFARTSWAAVHRSLSSALLLGIVKEPSRNDRVHVMLTKLIAVLSSIEYSDASEVPAPISRAVAALVRLNAYDMSDGSRSEAGSMVSGTDSASPHAQMHNILWGSTEFPGLPHVMIRPGDD
jgi:hypothetical protein